MAIRGGNTFRKERKYIKWRDEKGSEFRTSINDEGAELLRIGINWHLDIGRLEGAIELLYNVVRRGGSEEVKGGMGKGKGRKWFDEECMEGRKKLRISMREWKKVNEEKNRLEYLEVKEQYREILKRKKEIYNAKESEKINKLLKENDTKGIWNFIKGAVGNKRRGDAPSREEWERFVKSKEQGQEREGVEYMGMKVI